MTCQIRHLKTHLPQAVRLVAGGDARIVVRRYRQPVAALVPMADYWFLLELEEELQRRDWRPTGSAVQPSDVAEALVQLARTAEAGEARRRNYVPKRRHRRAVQPVRSLEREVAAGQCRETRRRP